MEHLFSFRGGYCWKPKIASVTGVVSSFLGTKMPRNAFLSHLYDTWKSEFGNETQTKLRLWLNCPSHVHITGADRKWNSCDLKEMIYSRSEINSSLFIIVKTHFRDWILITTAQCEYFNREPVFKPSITFFSAVSYPSSDVWFLQTATVNLSTSTLAEGRQDVCTMFKHIGSS